VEKILLHTCCGPCLLYPAKKLRSSFDVICFYSNSNIHPQAEYEKRRENAIVTANKLKFLFIEGKYDPKVYFGVIKNRKNRCEACYTLRLEETGKKAKELEIGNFSTTLLVSPYQDIKKIQEIGKKIAKRYDLTFHDSDFREGFKEGREMAFHSGLYLQKFCGCSFSYIEKFESKINLQQERGNGGTGSI